MAMMSKSRTESVRKLRNMDEESGVRKGCRKRMSSGMMTHGTPWAECSRRSRGKRGWEDV